jgi:hypothetical protein
MAPPSNSNRLLSHLHRFPAGYIFNSNRIARLAVAYEASGDLHNGSIEVVDSSERMNEVSYHFRIARRMPAQIETWPENTSSLSQDVVTEIAGDIPQNGNSIHSLVFLGCSQSLRLENGFSSLTILSLRNVSLRNEKHLSELSSLRYLDLKHNTSVERCDWLKGLDQLEVLDLRHTRVEQIPVDCLQKLGKLHHLLLGYIPSRECPNTLAGVQLNDIAKLQTNNLKTLRTIRQPTVTQFDIKHIANTVIDLSISGLTVNDELKNFWNAVNKFKNLTSLGMAVTEGTAITLRHCPADIKSRLKRLRMEGKFSGCSSSSQSHSVGLDELKNFQHLIDLTLISPEASPEQFGSINLPTFKKLVCLRLYGFRDQNLQFRGQEFNSLKKVVICNMKNVAKVQIDRALIKTVDTVKLCNLPLFIELGRLDDSKILLIKREEGRTVQPSQIISSQQNIFLRDVEGWFTVHENGTLKIYKYDT